MWRVVYVPILVACVTVASLAQAPPNAQGPQNSDLSILVGPVFGATMASATSGVAVRVTGTFVFQSSFGHTVHSFSFADLWLEFPVTTAVRESDTVGGGISTIDYNESFVTPGVRMNFPVRPRFSVYAAMGGGYANFEAYQNNSDGGRNRIQYTYHGVFEFGGGADFRLTRLLSLRADLRDFVTGRGLGGVDGRNHVLASFGVAGHF